jgi:hypothetical protein
MASIAALFSASPREVLFLKEKRTLGSKSALDSKVGFRTSVKVLDESPLVVDFEVPIALQELNRQSIR